MFITFYNISFSLLIIFFLVLGSFLFNFFFVSAYFCTSQITRLFIVIGFMLIAVSFLFFWPLILGSGTHLVVLLVLVLLLVGAILLKSLMLHRFKSDGDEI